MKFGKIIKILMTVSLFATLGNGMTALAEPVKVNASNLNFRTEADQNAAVIRLLPRGTVLERTADLGEWSQVTIDGTSGYAASRYLQECSETVVTQNPFAGAAWEASMDSDYQYASFSKISSGKAVLYESNSAARKGKVICVNAGHGTKGGSSVKTLCHPDGSAKVTSGTTAAGSTTASAISSGMTFSDGTPESSVTLAMAKVLRDKLLVEGYDVLMIREGEDVQLDNIARTVLANNLADCHIALHWDSTTSDKGCFYMSVPTNASYRAMEPVASHWESHNRLGSCLIEGLRDSGNKIFSSGAMEMDLTQTSYSTIPSVDIELGDKASSHTEETLAKLADGLIKGIDQFFTNGNTGL